MSLIRYQTPNCVLPSLDRWANLRDEMTIFSSCRSGPTSAVSRQLFNGWTPALDLYQNNDNIVAVVELPGMRKEDIEISLHDGTLTISGERKDANGETAERTRAFHWKIPSQHYAADASRFRTKSMPPTRMAF